MDYTRLFLAALGATVVYFATGFLFFAALPYLKNEYRKYPDIYRTPESMKRVAPVGLVAMFIAILSITVIYAMLFRGGSGVLQGAHFGVLIAIFALGSFVIHNHVNLNIGWRLTVGQAIAYFIEWTLVGLVIGLIYKPIPPN